MIPTRIWVGLAMVALAACKDEAPRPPRISQVFPNLPIPPNATVVSQSGGADALQITLMSPVKASEVETYYRALLSKNGWRLVNDMRNQDGSVVLLAQQNGPPLWVRIKSTDDSAATLVDLAGAVLPDTGKAAKPAS
jgi:hypothetical protein